jgi:hypothetical protein
MALLGPHVHNNTTVPFFLSSYLELGAVIFWNKKTFLENRLAGLSQVNTVTESVGRAKTITS